MLTKNPFITYIKEETLSDIVKNAEKRWGLTLISFLPTDAQKRIIELQHEISKYWCKHTDNYLRQSQVHIEFYQPEQFHLTHFTLTRSDPSGPLEAKKFVKNEHKLFELSEIIEKVICNTQSMNIRLDNLSMGHSGIEIILFGECSDKDSIKSRQELIKMLNKFLSDSFNLSRCIWDLDDSKAHRLHCTLGFIKRFAYQEYSAFSDYIKKINFDPIFLTINDISLVHHTYRTLKFPHEGRIDFPLNRNICISKDEFISKINLS